MPVFLRAALLTVPRFIVILAMVIGLSRLDPSPLPQSFVAWLAYLLHFIITFMFALWVMRKHMPSWREIIGVTGIFLVLGVFWEVGLYAWLTGTGVREVISGFTASSLFLIVIYSFAVALAGVYARRSYRPDNLPEGLSI